MEDGTQHPGKMLASVGTGVARHAMKGSSRYSGRVGSRIVRAWAPAVQSWYIDAAVPLRASSQREPHFEPAEQKDNGKTPIDPKSSLDKAFEILTRDIPDILKFEDDPERETRTDWSIYSDAFETDASNLVNPTVLRLLPWSTSIKGLSKNQEVLQDLRVFCSNYVKEHVVRAKTGTSVDKDTGAQVIQSEWKMELTMQRLQLRLLQPFFGDDSSPERVVVISAVSRFHFDDDGKIYRHSLDHLDMHPLKQENNGAGSPIGFA